MKIDGSTHYSKIKIALLIILASFVFYACTESQKDALGPFETRLFVSFADNDPAGRNLGYVSPADGVVLPNFIMYKTKAVDGNGVFFDETSISGTTFQVSRQTKSIIKLSINGFRLSEFTSPEMNSAREIAYDAKNDFLYVASNTDSMISVFNNASGATGTVTPFKKIKLNAQPWSIHLDAPANRLLVLIDKPVAVNPQVGEGDGPVEVQVFNNIEQTAKSGTQGSQIMPAANTVVKFPFARRLHGMTYSSSRDILVVTEIGSAAGGDPNFNKDGAIFIIENANIFLNTGGNITPTRTIAGANTLLGNPVDVAIDDRAGKERVIVAEKANKKILVFTLDMNGNVSPLIQKSTINSPEALYLDIRK